MAEDSKNPIGFILALPDINPLIKQINGKLLPFGWLVILKGIKHIKKFRVITLGVVKDHQNSIIAFRLISKLIQNGIKLGYDTAELSWILEDNHKMLKPLSRIGATQTQRFRIYEKKLS
ncbi:MAG: hypothetical protein HY606_00155 [Planctomycetes bacterium]|nr:hypothetical protein [Planctomycetota bacterium]